MSKVLTWDDIVALDDAALNMAIDTHIYGNTWNPVRHGDSDLGEWWGCPDVPNALVALSSVPYFDYTASWERSIALLWLQHISLATTNVPGTWVMWANKVPDALPLYATTEADARRQIVRLALWRAMREEEAP